jgi:dTMP kinase
MNMARGLFLTFEGIDGCGKTTQLDLLAEQLRGAGHDVVETVEPGGTEAGRAIRAILLDPRHNALMARTELLLYFASRAQNVSEVILPALERGAIVLCDRFTDSTIVYQGAGRGLDPTTILELHRIACGEIFPDLTILLDIDTETSLARARARNLETGSGETRLDDEGGAFFDRVRAGYLRLAAAEPKRIRMVNARGPVEVVAQDIWKEVNAIV